MIWRFRSRFSRAFIERSALYVGPHNIRVGYVCELMLKRGRSRGTPPYNLRDEDAVMTLVNFRRAICRLQLRRCCFASVPPAFPARPHLNCSANFAEPFSLIHRPRGRPRSKTLEKQSRLFLVQLSVFLPPCTRDDVSHASFTSFCSLYQRSLSHSLFPPAHSCTHTHTYTTVSEFSHAPPV